MSPLVKIINNVLDKILNLLTVTDTSLVEFQSSTALLAMSVLMLDPYPTLTAGFVNIPLFNLMNRVMPEFWWGVTFLILGAGQSWSNIFRHYSARKIMAFATCILWGLLAIMGTFSHPSSFFLPICGSVSLVMCIAYLRLAVNKNGHHGRF